MEMETTKITIAKVKITVGETDTDYFYKGFIFKKSDVYPLYWFVKGEFWNELHG